MHRFLLPAVLLSAAACRVAGSDYTIVEHPETWELQVVLDTYEARAGDLVTADLLLVSSKGNELVPEQWTFTSDLDQPLEWQDLGLVPHLAGLHTITVTVEHDGEPIDGQALLDVSAGPAWTVDLELSDYAFKAGGFVDYTIRAMDAYGNELGTTGLVPLIDSGDVYVGDGLISSTVPGIYTAEVLLDDAWDEEVFLVTTDVPYHIDLELADTDLELFETTTATVTVTDVWGNVTDDPWTMSVFGPGRVDISYVNLTFWDEGWYTVTATIDGTSISDSVGPLLIDSTGPNIDIWEPDRGEWVVGDTSTVEGNVYDEWSGVASLTLNGTGTTVSPTGDFSTVMTWDWATNVLESQAVDGDGNASTDTRALLSGDYLSWGNGVGDGIVARIHQGPGGFDTLEAIGEDLIAATDLDALIPYPLYSASEEWCHWKCWDAYVLKVWVYDPHYSSTDIELDPRSTGYLRGTATVWYPWLRWRIYAALDLTGYTGVSTNQYGYVDFDWIQAGTDLNAYVSSWQIYADLVSVWVNSGGFDFHISSSLGWIWDVLQFFGVDEWIEDAVMAYVEDAVEDVIADELPPIIEDTLQDLELSTDLDIMDNTYSFDAWPWWISTDANGMTLSLATWFLPDEWRSSWYAGHASLFADYNRPSSYSMSSGMYLSVDDDFLNQALFAFWGGGLLDQVLTADDIGLPADELTILFPTMTDPTIETEALLPPVVVPGTGRDLLELQLGDYWVGLYDNNTASRSIVLEAYVSVFVGLDVDVTASNTIRAELGEPEIYFDVVWPEANSIGAADTEALLEALVPLLLPTLTDALGEIPMPEIQGFSLDGVTVSKAGAEYGFLNLAGNLNVD